MTLTRRAEVMRRLGVTSNQLAYFERSELIEPSRRDWGNKRKPDAYYTQQQLIEIKAVAYLKPLVDGKELRLIIEYLRAVEDVEGFLCSYLVIKGDRLYSLSPEHFGQKLMEIVKDDGGGTFKIIEPIGLLEG